MPYTQEEIDAQKRRTKDAKIIFDRVNGELTELRNQVAAKMREYTDTRTSYVREHDTLIAMVLDDVI